MNRELALELTRILLRYGAMFPALLGAPQWVVNMVRAASTDQAVIGLLVGCLMAATAEVGWLKARANRARAAVRQGA